MAKVVDDFKRVINVAVDKTTDFVDKAQQKIKLYLSLNEKEKELKDLYIELGKKYCEMVKDQDDESALKAKKLEDEIAEIKETLKRDK